MQALVVGPAVAGSWYPAEARGLARMVDDLLDAAPARTPPALPTGLVVPHAGYVYSGATAAAGFRTVRGSRYRRVVLVGPSHYAAYPGAALPRAAGYRTPLGDVPLDEEAIATLLDDPAFHRDDRPFAREHSLEAELPFLQQALQPGWRVVPLLLGGGRGGADAAAVAAALGSLAGEDTLFVASSDFTHFGPRFDYVPFADDVPERIERLDRGAIDAVLAADAERFKSYLERTRATVCGRDAIEVLLRLEGPARSGELVAYDTSGRITGEWSHSVSYASIALFPSLGGRT